MWELEKENQHYENQFNFFKTNVDTPIRCKKFRIFLGRTISSGYRTLWKLDPAGIIKVWYSPNTFKPLKCFLVYLVHVQSVNAHGAFEKPKCLSSLPLSFFSFSLSVDLLKRENRPTLLSFPEKKINLLNVFGGDSSKGRGILSRCKEPIALSRSRHKNPPPLRPHYVHKLRFMICLSHAL